MLKNLSRLTILTCALMLSGVTHADSTDSKSMIAKAQDSAVEMKNDVAIVAAIKAQLLADPDVSAFKVDVTSHDGVVTLKGNLDNDQQAAKAVGIALATKNVKDVKADELTVKDSKQPIIDIVLTAKVKGLLIKEDLFGKDDVSSTSVHVTTNNGVFYLTGDVSSEDIAKKAVELAKSIGGVKSVESTLQVKASK